MQEESKVAGRAAAMDAFTEKLLESNRQSVQDQMKNCQEQLTSYTDLAANLLKLSKKSTAQVMVPLCDIAFMPAKLKHTNEVHVHLGDGMFVERTAHECQDIIDRRKQLYQKKLEHLESTMSKQTGISDLFTERQKDSKDNPLTTPGGIPTTKVNDEGFLEIFEPYDSDDGGVAKPIKPVPKVVLKPAAKSSVQYVDFDFGASSFSKAQSPADLRRVMDARAKQAPTQPEPVAPAKSILKPTQAPVFDQMTAFPNSGPVASRIVERTDDQRAQQQEKNLAAPVRMVSQAKNSDSEEEEKPKKKLSKFAQARLDAQREAAQQQ